MLSFFNSLCFGMENIINEFRCDHLIDFDKSYIIEDYVDEQPSGKSVLCPNCAKAELMKRLKKWANLDKPPFFHCGLLIPAEGVKIKYCEPKNNMTGYYIVSPSNDKYLPDKDIVQKEVVPEGNEAYMTNFFHIDLNNNYEKKAKVYVCKYCFCERCDDVVYIEKDAYVNKNINYNSGQNYKEVRNCEDNGHVKLGYTVEIN